jgi:hypothetical protein
MKFLVCVLLLVLAAVSAFVPASFSAAKTTVLVSFMFRAAYEVAARSLCRRASAVHSSIELHHQSSWSCSSSLERAAGAKRRILVLHARCSKHLLCKHFLTARCMQAPAVQRQSCTTVYATCSIGAACFTAHALDAELCFFFAVACLQRAEQKEGEPKKHIGTGGMADTRDPEPKDDPDPRKSISKAPSFEEYLKSRCVLILHGLCT